MNDNDKCAWILTSGTSTNSEFWKNSTDDLPIIEKDSVPEINDKKDSNEMKTLLQHYSRILSNIDSNSIRIYTDGAKSGDTAGAGYIIYKGEEVIHSDSKRLTNCEAPSAELYAIYHAMEYVKCELHPPAKANVHLFTDSRHSLDSIAEHSQISRDHHIINKIQTSIKRMNIELILHWIPSHVETVVNGNILRIEGNAIADIIAKRALGSNNMPLNYQRYFLETPKRITRISSKMTYTIDLKIYKVLREAKASQNAGPSQDDFSSSDAQQISLSSATS